MKIVLSLGLLAALATGENCQSLTANMEGMIGAYVPQCDENGDFLARQCHGSIGTCWCVDTKTGEKLEGSSRGPNEGEVECNGAPTPLLGGNLFPGILPVEIDTTMEAFKQEQPPAPLMGGPPMMGSASGSEEVNCCGGGSGCGYLWCRSLGKDPATACVRPWMMPVADNGEQMDFERDCKVEEPQVPITGFHPIIGEEIDLETIQADAEKTKEKEDEDQSPPIYGAQPVFTGDLGEKMIKDGKLKQPPHLLEDNPGKIHAFKPVIGGNLDVKDIFRRGRERTKGLRGRKIGLGPQINANIFKNPSPPKSQSTEPSNIGLYASVLGVSVAAFAVWKYFSASPASV